MPAIQPLTITLTDDMAADVRGRIASGEHGSADDVIREALKALRTQNDALEHWLRTEVAASYDELRAHPETGIPLEAVRARLAARARRDQD